VQTITVGDVKDDDTKEKKRKHDKWKKKKNGGKAVKHAFVCFANGKQSIFNFLQDTQVCKLCALASHLHPLGMK
jgi:hypothetical protein